ncbi:MAG TPA: response regulator transcription factor [Puia sp.]|nr:response regulator transcription factor [Puia sp.]
MRRFLIADDHSVVRKGLKHILLEAFPSATIEEVTNAEDLYKRVSTEEWDVVISDISMPGRSGLEMLQQIRQDHPKLPYLILSVHSEDQYAIRVLKAGASGYLNKESANEELVKAINQLLIGKRYITASIAEKLASTLDQNAEKMPHEYLSDREFEVFKLLASGRAVSEIAEKIFLSVTTVSTYRARIMVKMNLKTNADLTLYAIEHKLM